MIHQLSQFTTFVKHRFWKITEPSESIEDTHRRNQIRLINSIVLFFVPIAIFAGLTHIFLSRSTTPLLTDPAVIVIVLSVILLLIAAFISRFLGFWGTTGLVFIVGYFVIMFNASFDAPDYFDAAYIILLSVLASALFNIKLIAITAIVEVVSVNLLLTTTSPVNSVNLSIFLIVSNLIIIFTVYYRTLIEKESRQKIVDSEAFLRLITKQMPVSVWITDEKLSRRATFGRLPQIDQLVTIPTNKSLGAYRQALTGESVQFEIKHLQRYFQYHIEPMRDDDEQIIGTLGVATDITEQKLAQEHSLQLQLERERVAILSKFIEHSSHDLRTPISNINTYLYLLEHTVKTEKERDYINVIRHQSQRLHGLITNMLMLQRLELEAQQDLSEVSLKSLLDALDIAYRERIEVTGTLFEYDAPTQPIILNVVEKNIYMAISKVLDNAIQFTPPKGTIRLYTTRTGDTVTISVQDTGTGISDEQLPHIFEIFYRGDDSRPSTNGDNGLGLTIVERIIKSHRGTVTVDSVLNEGTTVHITLPIVNLKQLV